MIENKVELYCREHDKIITHVSQTFYSGSYLRCQKCNMNNQELMSLDQFLTNLENLKSEMKKKEDTLRSKYNQITAPLKKCLKNFYSDFGEFKDKILNSIEQIAIHIQEDYTGQLLFQSMEPSLKSLNETCSKFVQTMNFSQQQQVENDAKIQLETFEKQKKQSHYHLNLAKLLGKFCEMCKYHNKLIVEAFKLIEQNNAPIYEVNITQELPQISQYCNPTMVLDNDTISPTLAIGIPNSIILYEIKDSIALKEIQKIETKFTPKSLFFSDDNQILVSIENDTQIHFFKKQGDKYQKQSRLFFQQCQSLDSVIISKGNDEMITNCGHLLYCLSLKSVLSQNIYKVLEEGLKGHTQTINQISYNCEQDKLISCSQDKTVIIWQKQIDKETNISIWKISQIVNQNGSVLSCCFIIDNLFAVQINMEKFIRFFEKKDTGNYVEQSKVTLDSCARWECSNQKFKYDMNTKLLVVKGNKEIYLIYNIGKSNCLSIEQKIDGKFILAHSQNHYHIVLWNMDTQQLMIYKQVQRQKPDLSKFEKRYCP